MLQRQRKGGEPLVSRDHSLGKVFEEVPAEKERRCSPRNRSASYNEPAIAGSVRDALDFGRGRTRSESHIRNQRG